MATALRLDKTFETKLQAKQGERAVIARITTATVDRDKDVVLPAGVDLKDFRKNPVVLFGHDGQRYPVGTVPNGGFEKNTDGITAKVEFAERPDTLPDEVEWPADTVLSLFQQGVLRAFSIGFTVQSWRDATEKDKRKFGDDAERIIEKWTLLEFSVVTVPANQDALAVAVSKGFDLDSFTGKVICDGCDSLAVPGPIEYVEPQPLQLS